jgi:hypothetical protein
MAKSGDPQAAFAEWLRSAGGFLHPSLDLFGALPHGDRGVVATAAIPEGEQLLLIPRHLCLHVPQAGDTAAGGHAAAPPDDSPALAAIAALDPAPSPIFATVLLLMAERARGAASAFAPYLGVLPEAHDCLLSWTDEERQGLAGTGARRARSLQLCAHAALMRAEPASDVYILVLLLARAALERGPADDPAAAVHAREVSPLCASRPDVWPPAACGAAAFEWAMGMVQSRAFHLVADNWLTRAREEGAALYLIPAIDMLNHATRPEARNTELRMSSEEATATCGRPPREVTLRGFFTMRAERAVAPGEQVLHTYGDLSDAALLQTFGFVEELGEGGNPHNQVHLPLAAVEQACAAVLASCGERGVAAAGPARAALLRRLGVAGEAFALPAGEPLTAELLTAAQVLMMPEDEFAEFAAEVGGADDGAEALLGREYLEDGDFREGVCMALLAATQAALRKVAAAAAAAAGGAAGWRGECAARVAAGQRAGLERLKRQVMELLAEGGGSGGGSDEDSDEGSSGSEGGGSSQGGGDSSAGEEDEAEEEAQPAKRRKAT